MNLFLTIAFIINLHYLEAFNIPSPPKITKQPPLDELLFDVEKFSSENRKPCYIECEAVGEPFPKFRWTKNGQNLNLDTFDRRIIQQIGRGTLSIKYLTDDDVGQYQCFAENEFGVAMSNSVFIRKTELGSFNNTSLVLMRGNEGESFKLSCQPSPDGWPKPKVFWVIQEITGGIRTINSSRITTDSEGNLWFSNLTKEDANGDFTYVCGVTSTNKFEYKLGHRVKLEVDSSELYLNLEREPIIQYVSRKNEVGLKGKTVELFCIFGGSPLPKTIWFKNEDRIQFSDRINEGNYGKSLVIKPADFDDEGTYTCEVNNGIGESRSFSINLKILSVPYFTEEPEDIYVAEGETIEFRCEASGQPKPEIKWIYNGKPIVEAPLNLRRTVETNKIIIGNVSREDIGNYGCHATNSVGYIYKEVSANILTMEPYFTQNPENVESLHGKNATITCRVFGVPKPEVKWIYDNKILTGNKFTILYNGDLHISNVQFDDIGHYRCKAENKYGFVSAGANLIIRERTKIIEGPKYFSVTETGSLVTFDCKSKHDPNLEPEVLWFHNGEEINFNNQSRIVMRTDFSLTITSVEEADAGSYSCVVQTRVDQDEASSTLIVQRM